MELNEIVSHIVRVDRLGELNNDTLPTIKSPYFLNTLLWQQVEEQSDFCDFTITVGHWCKRYHRCVLVASPFFQCLLGHSFKEKQTGSLDIKLGTPATVERVISYLYGRSPQLSNLDDVINTLEMAEFLLLPELKEECAEWLSTVKPCNDNVHKLLHVSSLYDIEMAGLENYIRGHLDELLLQDQLLSLTMDSIVYLFSDERLSYVDMDTRLIFLCNWVTQNHARLLYFNDLLSHIDMHGLSPERIIMLKTNSTFKDMPFIKEFVPVVRTDVDEKHLVLVCPSPNETEVIWAFDIVQQAWYRLKAPRNDLSTNCVISADDSVIYTDSHDSIGILDIENDKYATARLNMPVDYEHGDCYINGRSTIDISNRQCYNIQHCVVYVDDAYDDYYMRLLQRPHPAYACTLYRGGIDHQAGKVNMLPILSFKPDKVETPSRVRLFLSKAVCLLIKDGTGAVLYDTVDCQLHKLDIVNTDDDKVRATPEGFVIYNEERIIDISRISSLKTEACRIRNIAVPRDGFIYECIGDRWLRQIDDRRRVDTLQYALHEDVAVSGSINDSNWIEIPLPTDDCFGIGYHLDKAVMLRLSKTKLKCHIECPHCEAQASGNRQTSRSWLFMDRYEADSDDNYWHGDYDDNYWYPGHDDSDNFYDSSDY